MPDTVTIELPLDTWRQHPDGSRLATEMNRIANGVASERGHALGRCLSVTTDKARGVYVVTYEAKATS